MSNLPLKAAGAEIFIPDGKSLEEALKRTTHIGIGAHQDDLEFMAYHGILECFGKKDKGFMGIIVTNGSGSARDAHYKDYTDQQMMEVRKLEQKKAAYVGEYSALFLLNHPSSAVKAAQDPNVAADLDLIFSRCRPEAIYTHNLADKHDTHVGVALRTIAALRRLPKDKRPKKLIGCEVWRSLDWLCDPDKVVMPVDDHENLADALMGVFDSQICGGKRYDLATRGRRLANASYFESHAVDKNKGLAWGMDLSALLADDSKDPFEYAKSYIDRFTAEVKDRIGRLGGR
jgi:LmbE family N-acetylglucosaminyl deacetylase